VNQDYMRRQQMQQGHEHARRMAQEAAARAHKHSIQGQQASQAAHEHAQRVARDAAVRAQEQAHRMAQEAMARAQAHRASLRGPVGASSAHSVRVGPRTTQVANIIVSTTILVLIIAFAVLAVWWMNSGGRLP
jgi:hypothetical protein